MDDTLTQLQTRRIHPGVIRMRCNDLKASPPLDILDKVLLVSHLSMFVALFGRLTAETGALWNVD